MQLINNINKTILLKFFRPFSIKLLLIGQHVKKSKEETETNISLGNNNKNLTKELLIENRNETLFWKVFRNKFLFKTIFSTFVNSNLYSYSRLYYVYNIYEDFKNGIEIIRDKVKTNSYLIFSGKGLERILENIKEDTKENQLFYNQLIDNYCNSSVHYMKFFDRITNYSNLFALKSFINFYKKYKNDNYLQICQHLIKDHSNSIIIIESIIIKPFNIFHELKLFQLIDIIKTLLLDEDFFKFLSKQNKELLLNLPKLTLKDIKEFQFTNEELNENLFMVLKPLTRWNKYYKKLNKNYNNNNNNKTIDYKEQISKIKEDILKLYNNEFIKINEELNGLIYFVEENELNEEKYREIENIQNEQKIIQNQINELFKKQNELIKKEEENSKLSDEMVKKREVIFKYIELFYSITYKKDKEKPIEYYLSKNEKNEIIEIVSGNSQGKLFEYGVPNDEILGIYINNSHPIDVIKNIKSIEMLDFIFKHFREVFFKKENSNWKYCKSMEIVEHYEKLMKSLNRKFLFKYKNPLRINLAYNQMIPELLSRAINNPLLYTPICSPTIFPKKELRVTGSIENQNAFLSLLESNFFEVILFSRSFNFIKNKEISRYILNNSIINLVGPEIESSYYRILIQLPSYSERNKKEDYHHHHHHNNKNNEKVDNNNLEDDDEDGSDYEDNGYVEGFDYSDSSDDDEDNSDCEDNGYIEGFDFSDSSDDEDYLGRNKFYYEEIEHLDNSYPNVNVNGGDGIIEIFLSYYHIFEILYNSNRFNEAKGFFRDVESVEVIPPHVLLPLFDGLIPLLISTKDKDDSTVYFIMHVLAEHGNITIIQYLISNYNQLFKYNTTNEDDLKTLLDIAIFCDYPQLFEILFDYIKYTREEFTSQLEEKDEEDSIISYGYIDRFKSEKKK
ncbi:hypothetical protein ACTA71_000154 [Dictyostelium dimigraforme]